MRSEMTSRTKSALVLLGTLVLGMAIGAMLWSAVHTRQMEKIRSLREHRTLTDLIVGIVEPVDDAQRVLVENAVSDYQEGMTAVYDEMGRTRRAASDSLREELSHFLNPAQQKNFDDWLSRNRRGSRSGSRADSTNQRAE
jgi:hypothetical protein